MRTEYDIIRRPIITEKAAILRDTANAYVFEVARDASKEEIKRAVEKIFDVEVLKVRTMVMASKPKGYRYGRQGRRGMWKKAVVFLKEGHEIEVMEGV